MHILIDDMKTQYVHNDLIQQLTELLSTYEADATIDLAGAKLGNACSAIICNNFSKFRFIDTSNSDWNIVYENNYKVAHNYYSIGVEPFKYQFRTMLDFMNYVKSDFDVEKIYKLGELSSSTKTLRVFSFVILFILIRPDVNIDITKHANRIFSQIRLDWFYDENTHYESYYDATRGFIKRTVNKDRTLTIEGVGNMSEYDFLSRYIAVPSTFGTVKLYKNSEWYEVVRNCTINIDNTDDDYNSTTIADLLW